MTSLLLLSPSVHCLDRSRSQPSVMYVLDYILERKGVGDLANSIKDQRYCQQKHFMRLCGLSRTMYLLEGDPDFDASIKGERLSAISVRVPHIPFS